MSFVNSMKSFFFEEYDEDEMEMEEEERFERKPVEKRPELEEIRTPSRKSYSTRYGEEKVVPMQKSTINTNAYKLVVLEPKGLEETPKLVDNLKSRKPIIVNLEKLDSDVARKIFDFLNGATYALNGSVQKVSTNIFIFAPENVSINSGADKDRQDSGRSF